MNNSSQEYWNNIYTSKEIDSLGWYEEAPTASIQLFSQCNLDKAAPILEVGAGATTFIDYLLENQYNNISAIDISNVALSKLQQRLGIERAASVNWIVDDLTQPKYLTQLEAIALWHDRAVLHFLVEESHRQTYFSTLKKIVKPTGYVIIAAFSLEGAKMCSGWNVRNYDCEMIATELGDNFKLLETFDYIYQMPSGDVRPYIYTLFQRNAL
jgi:cyclopropane fatty-acyl-phospholipid synthase-like methyltransferase